jgi:hypothetical protein
LKENILFYSILFYCLRRAATIFLSVPRCKTLESAASAILYILRSCSHLGFHICSHLTINILSHLPQQSCSRLLLYIHKAAVFYSPLQPSVLRIAALFSCSHLLIPSCSHLLFHSCSHVGIPAFYSKAAVFYSSLQPFVLRIAALFSCCHLLIHSCSPLLLNSCSHVVEHSCTHLLLHN